MCVFQGKVGLGGEDGGGVLVLRSGKKVSLESICILQKVDCPFFRGQKA